MLDPALACVRLNSAHRLREILSKIPTHPMIASGARKSDELYTEYQVLDRVKGGVLLRQSFRETHCIAKPLAGIATFDDGVTRGILTPEGEVISLDGTCHWRMLIADYHAGWIITVLQEQRYRSMSAKLTPQLWGGMAASIKNEYLRSCVVGETVAKGVPAAASYEDYLLFCHEHHCKSLGGSGSFHEPKIAFV